MVNLSRVDLNLLVVLQSILDEGGVSPAAQKLNLTQPTISHALARLRTLFDDPLFVRQGRRLAPTAFTRSLAEPLAQALRSLGAVLATPSRFDPRETPAVFTVAMRDPMEMAVLPRFARYLATVAPRRFVPHAADLAGEVDGLSNWRTDVAGSPWMPSPTSPPNTLVQDAAYGTLLRSHRQQIYGCIATALESQFPEIVGHHGSLGSGNENGSFDHLVRMLAQKRAA